MSALGVLRFENGEEEAARSIYEKELLLGAAGVPRGMFRLTRLALLSELSALLHDGTGAKQLYETLLPYAACNVVVTYCSFWGPVEGYLALLAATCGNPKLAVQHLKEALARTRAMAAPLLTESLQRRYENLLRSAAP